MDSSLRWSTRTRWSRWCCLLVGLRAVGGLRASVGIVTYDRPAYLARALEQVAAQTYPRELVDVVVIDDTPTSCRSAVEASLGQGLDNVFGQRLDYVHLSGRASIGAKRRMAAERLAARARGQRAVAVTWDDDDVYGSDRLERQLAPIAAGEADATVATPTWRFEAAPGEAAAVDMHWPLVPRLVARIDPLCDLGLELVDEAIASLCYRLELHDAEEATYPDVSYDEDRAFIRALKGQGVRLRRLPPDEPLYVHVKHKDAAARGPLTALYGTGGGALASPPVAIAATAASYALATSACRGLLGALHLR